MQATGLRGWRWLVLGATLSPWVVMPARSMQFPIAGPATQTAGRPVDRGLDPTRPEDEIPFGVREIQARQMKRMREEHQKQVMADTARLLQLATTLKAEADKEADNGAKPSPSALKDLDEIARLAKKLSERIKTQ